MSFIEVKLKLSHEANYGLNLTVIVIGFGFILIPEFGKLSRNGRLSGLLEICIMKIFTNTAQTKNQKSSVTTTEPKYKITIGSVDLNLL